MGEYIKMILFNVPHVTGKEINIKEVIKKSVQVVGLTSALFMGGMGLTGCQHDIPHEPEEPTIEKPAEKPTDQCTICDGLQEEPCGILHLCDDEECLDHNEEAQKYGHIHDYCDEQECADKKVTDKNHQHDYCKDCEGIQTDPKHTCPIPEPTPEPDQPVKPSQPLTPLQPAYCADEDCLKKGQSMEGHTHDYCNEQECANIDVTDKNHVHDYCNIGDCANITVTDKNHQHDYCGDETCLNKDKTSPDHQHDYCGDGNCLNMDKTSPDHQHDYCNDCEGNQTDPKHTCPVVEEPILSAEVKHIGNGTYTIANFMVNDNADDSINQKVADGLECAEKYIKGALGSFTPEFQAKYSEELALITDENAFKQSTTSGFDFTINRLNGSCAPIFEEIIEKIDTPLDRYSFICYYNALSNEAYKHGSGDYFNGNQIQEETYNNKKEQIQRDFADNYAFEGLPTPFNIIEDIENNNCDRITNQMKNLLTNSNVADDMGITETDLDNLINLSANVSSLDAMHDYSASKKLSTHASCVTSGNTLENVMLEKTVELDNAGMAMLNNKNNIQDRELC